MSTTKLLSARATLLRLAIKRKRATRLPVPQEWHKELADIRCRLKERLEV
jgi:hypothetical protein